MQKWEYLEVIWQSGKLRAYKEPYKTKFESLYYPDLNQYLDFLGFNGWELINFRESTSIDNKFWWTMLFKRPIG